MAVEGIPISQKLNVLIIVLDLTVINNAWYSLQNDLYLNAEI